MHLVLVTILCLNLICAAVQNDICDRCVPKEKCDVFLNLNAKNQQSWMEKYSCNAPSDDDEYAKYYEFAPTGKGNFVCCGNTLWGTEEKHSQHETKNLDTNKRNENDYYPQNNYNNSPQNKNEYPNNQAKASFDSESGGSNLRNINMLPNEYQNSYPNQYGSDIGNNYAINNAQPFPMPTFRPPFDNPAYQNNGNMNLERQCALTSFPPKLEGECCGKETSDGDRIFVTPPPLAPPLSNNNFAPNDITFDFSQEIPIWLTWNLKNTPESGNMYRRDTTLPDITLVPRIAGGKETELHQFPWTVLLNTIFDYGSQQAAFSCGGSLISTRYVLTAAHCLYNENGPIVRVEAYLAEYDKRTFPTDCKTVFGVGQKCVQNIVMFAENVILHSQYEDSTLSNDIALIRLSDYAPYTEYIRPICLPPMDINNQMYSRMPLSVAGWGRNGTFQSDVKQSTVVNLVAPEQCVLPYPDLTRTQMCAVGYSGEDTCKGDSGGPLMTVYRGKYFIVGVVSGKRIGSPCGSSVPSLYTNVFMYLEWILSNIRN